MSLRQKKLIEQYLSDEIDSDESIVYDSDADPEYIVVHKRLQNSIAVMISTHRIQVKEH